MTAQKVSEVEVTAPKVSELEVTAQQVSEVEATAKSPSPEVLNSGFSPHRLAVQVPLSR